MTGLTNSTETTKDSKLVHRFSPLNDPRWDKFVQRHPRSSVFHSSEWLEALRRTYGYESTAITTCPPDADLQNALVLCRVESWLTGRRLVSLPFSDHCDVLVDGAADLVAIVSALENQLCQQKLRYIEVRPTHPLHTSTLRFHSTYTYCLHQIDIRPDLDTLYSNCHKDSTQRKIRRAQREGLTYEEGRSAFFLDSFYRLLVLTRRRHMVPPQPKRWFQNLIDCFGEALKIRVAVKNKQAIAAILTLRYKDTLVYKYGCSDSKFHNLGGMYFLFWRSIQEAKQDGLCVFDLGRSEWEDTGLITFKDRWGAKRSALTYLRFVASAQSKSAFRSAGADWKARAAKKVFPRLPDRILSLAGDLIYKHMG
jgi:lipid II:glycine glycyltransferase (peptidoglycan interpeptide bridge formation enzyme)